MMEGLAQQMAQPAMPQEQTQEVAIMQKIIQLLMEGMDPEEIVKMGVPPEIVMEAIAMMEQQMAAQQSPDQGLAAQSAGGM
jgi:hypothetical protein